MVDAVFKYDRETETCREATPEEAAEHWKALALERMCELQAQLDAEVLIYGPRTLRMWLEAYVADLKKEEARQAVFTPLEIAAIKQDFEKE